MTSPAPQPGSWEARIHALHSSELLELYVQSVTDYAMFCLDEQGYVRTWNAGAQRIKGYEANDIIGRHFSIFYPPQDIERGKPQHVLEAARKEGRFQDEGWRIRKDGSRFWASVVVTPLLHEGDLIGFAKVTRDLTERHRAEQHEHARLVDLEKLDRFKDDLLAALGHDLKTPLTSMKGFTQLMLQQLAHGAPNLEQLAQGLTVVHAQVGRMTRMANDLLDASSIGAGVLNLRRAPCDLLECLAAVSGQLEPASRERLQIAAWGPPPLGNWDQQKIREVLSNLIANALKYSPAAEAVSVAVHERDGETEVAVGDHGMGIAAEELPQLFERFRRTRAAQASMISGTGLGLFICKGIIEAHGGRIWAESDGEGRGATFRFTLPND